MFKSKYTSAGVALALVVSLAPATQAVPLPSTTYPSQSFQTADSAQTAYCETSDDLTFGGVFNLVMAQIEPAFRSDPAAYRQFQSRSREMEKNLGDIPLNRQLVVTPASQIGGPSREVDNHAVNLLVGNLMKGRNSNWTDTVALRDITINEAIESILTAFYFGSIPVELWGKVSPNLLNVTVFYFVSIGLLTPVKLGAQYGPKIILSLGDAIQHQLGQTCLSTNPSDSHPGRYEDRPTLRESHPKGAALVDKTPLSPAATMFQNGVDGLSVAGEDCPPISDTTLRDFSQLVLRELRTQVRPQYVSTYDEAADIYLAQLEQLKINKGLLPLKGRDIGGLIGVIDDPALSYAFGVMTSIPDGRARQWVPIGDITLDNGMDYATITFEVAETIATIMYKLTVVKMGNGVANILPGQIPGPQDVACTLSLLPLKVLGSAAGSAFPPPGYSRQGCQLWPVHLYLPHHIWVAA